MYTHTHVCCCFFRQDICRSPYECDTLGKSGSVNVINSNT